MRKSRALSAFLLILLLSGCAGIPLSEEALVQIDPSLDYTEVKADPERFQGRTILLGGQIIANEAGREGSTLEILRYHLDRSGRPSRVDESGGRFLVRAERFLDPEVYEKGGLITLTGTVAGRETKPLNGIDYTYPLFRLGEAYLWKEPQYPLYYNPYYPSGYYYPPYYDPFGYPFGPSWYDPFWDHRRPWGWW